MNTAYRLVLIVLFGCFMATCQKEVSIDNGPVPGPGNNPVTITASVVGRVIDETGDPVQGASVKAGASFTTTDVNGQFLLNNAQLVDKAAYVTVTKAGYFGGSRTFIARQGHKHFVEIQLIPKIEVGSISGNTGGTINLGNGSAITLPANGVVVQSTGAAYTGAVKVSMAWIDPTSKDLFRQMPGDLRGTDANNNEVGMESYGMIGVELNGTGGEKLQIASGKKATLKFPLPSSIQGTAPATIALWSFDDAKGLWKQEGSATKSGSYYSADVSHFSWWNCDIPITTAAYFSATLVDQNGQALSGYHVSVLRPNNQFSGAHGFTDSAGYIIGRVPANEALVLKVDAPYPCYTVLTTQNIGPFTTNTTTNIGTITVNTSSLNMVTLTGVAQDCSNAPITNGYIEVTSSGYAMYRKNISNGSFSLSFPKCSPGLVTYYVVDKSANQQSSPVTINVSTGTTNVGTVTACGVSTLEYIDFTIDGQSLSLSNADSVGAANNQGAATLMIYGSQPAGGSANGNNVVFFINNLGATGNFPLLSLTGRINNTNYFQYPNNLTNGISVVVTSDGGLGSYIAGSFSGVIVDNASVSHPVQCNFRVRRY